MAIVNRAKREINAKIVYFGPPRAGKTTSLQFIHRKLKPEHCSTMRSMAAQLDRMLFFDFMPPELGEVDGCRVRFHLYTVQGEVSSPATWKTLLKGADGVVFVADGTTVGSRANAESMEQLAGFLAGFGQTIAGLPFVVQCNKADTGGDLDPDTVRASLGGATFVLVPSSAVTGEGVLHCLAHVIKEILKNLRGQAGEVPEAAEPAVGSPGEPIPSTLVERGTATVTAAAGSEGTPAAVTLEAAPGLALPVESGIEIAGPPEVAVGLCRIPLVLAVGAERRRYCLTVSLTEDESS